MKAEINGIVFDGQASEFVELVLALQKQKVEKTLEEKPKKYSAAKNSRWTEEEKRELLSLREQGFGYAAIAKKLNKSQDTCRGFAFELRKKQMPEKKAESKNVQKPEWTDSEKRLLWSMAVKEVPWNIISEKLGRSNGACRVKLSVMRHSPDTKKQLGGERKVSKKRYPSRFKKWIDTEKEFIKTEAAKGSTNGQISRQLGRTKGGVAVMKSILLKKAITKINGG